MQDLLTIPTVEQYQSVIEKNLSSKQIEVLQTLYYYPNASATAKDLAKSLNYKSYHAANRQIGQIGKIISRNTNITPPSYRGKNLEQPAYFILVGEYHSDSGWEMWEELQQALENLDLVSDTISNDIERLPTELFPFEEIKLYKEGKVVEVYVNRYERNQKARQECIRFYGYKCIACGFDFGTTYGDIANGFIHVHHLNKLADIGEEYELNPIKDMVPLCANCHSVVHLANPIMEIEELKKILAKQISIWLIDRKSLKSK